MAAHIWRIVGYRESFSNVGVGGITCRNQRRVSDLARASTLVLRSTQIAQPKREADLTAVSVDTSLQGTIEGVRSLLHAIETGDPLLFVEGLSIRTIAAPQTQQRPVSLDIKLKVRGYAVTNKVN